MKGLFKRQKDGCWCYKRLVSIPTELAIDPYHASTEVRGSTYEEDYEAACEVFLKVIAKTKRHLEEGPPRRRYTLRDGIYEYEKTRRTRKQRTDVGFHLETLDRFLGNVPLQLIHSSHPKLEEMIQYSRERGNSNTTINKRIGVLSYILRMASNELRDEHNRAWIDSYTRLKELPEDGAIKGYPLTGGQERELFKALPERFVDPVRFAIHTGLRDKYIRGLKWSDEVFISGIGSVFDIGNKNGKPHRVVLNSIAAEIVEKARGRHPEFVFTYLFNGHENRPFASPFNRRAFQRAVKAAGLSNARAEGYPLRFHDLRHTFATRLKAMDVPWHTIQDLMGHANGSITALYTGLETTRLLEASEKLVEWYDVGPSLFVRRTGQQTSNELRHRAS